MATGTNGIATKQDLWDLSGVSSHQVSNPTKCFTYSTDSNDTDLITTTHSIILGPWVTSSYSNDQCRKYSDCCYLDKPTSTTFLAANIAPQTGALIFAFEKAGTYVGNHKWFSKSITLTPPSTAVVQFVGTNGILGSIPVNSGIVTGKTMSGMIQLNSAMSTLLSNTKRLIALFSGAWYNQSEQYAFQHGLSQVSVAWPLNQV